jgi:lysophospholipase L1-like esterase
LGDVKGVEAGGALLASTAAEGRDILFTVIRGTTQQVTRTFKTGQARPPLSVGSQGDWAVSAPGVVPLHFWLQFDGRDLYAASGAGTAYLDGAALGPNWTVVPERAELRFGFALLRCGDRERTSPRVAVTGRSVRRIWARSAAAAALLLLTLLLAVALLIGSRHESSPKAVASSPALPAAPVASAASSPELSNVDPLTAPVEESLPVPLPLPEARRSIGASPPALLPAVRAPHPFLQNVANQPVPRVGAEPNQIAEEWLAHHQRQLHASNRARAKVVFLGDSITEGWGASPAYRDTFAKYSPLNLGIAGDCTQNVLWRVENGALDGTDPRVVVLMVGINNLAGGFTPEQTMQGVRAIVDDVRRRVPGARVLLLAVLPARQDAANRLRQRIIETNRLLRSLEQPGHVELHDVGSVLLEPDGSISKTVLRDFVHPTPLGYERLSQAVLPFIDAIGQFVGN